MTNITSFIKKWNNRRLEDWGSSVSKEYHSFQVAFINQLRKIAQNNGAEVINPSYGHYDMSCFIKKNDNYVYVNYSNALDRMGRTHVVLKHTTNNSFLPPMLVRTAQNERDYRGGINHFCNFENCEGLINKLLL